jgi:hypothetical protein
MKALMWHLCQRTQNVKWLRLWFEYDLAQSRAAARVQKRRRDRLKRTAAVADKSGNGKPKGN